MDWLMCLCLISVLVGAVLISGAGVASEQGEQAAAWVLLGLGLMVIISAVCAARYA